MSLYLGNTQLASGHALQKSFCHTSCNCPPGPNKPGDINSFLFLSLYHVAALQREGLRIYDAYLDAIVPRATPVIHSLRNC